MKSNLDKLFKTNSDLEKEGILFEVSDGVRFKVKRFSADNPAVKQLMAKYYKPIAKSIEAGGVSDEKQQEIGIRVFVESSVIGWEGVEIDGQLKEFNTEDCINLLKSLPILAENLINYASDFKNYREEVGNS